MFRFIQYNATSLEKNYKYDLLAEHDLGITIDLINPDAYIQEEDAHLDPADERLLEDDTHHPPQDAKRYVLILPLSIGTIFKQSFQESATRQECVLAEANRVHLN